MVQYTWSSALEVSGALLEISVYSPHILHIILHIFF